MSARLVYILGMVGAGLSGATAGYFFGQGGFLLVCAGIASGGVAVGSLFLHSGEGARDA